MEKLNGKKSTNMYIVDELDEIAKIYEDKFEELWNSSTPNLNDDSINFGEIIVFGTINSKKYGEDGV